MKRCMILLSFITMKDSVMDCKYTKISYILQIYKMTSYQRFLKKRGHSNERPAFLLIRKKIIDIGCCLPPRRHRSHN